MIEDAHWADEATLDLLVFLGRRIEQTRALLIVTYRDDELAVDHPLRTVIGRMPAEAVRHLRPEPLSEQAVAELARRAGRPAAGLRAVTGGNPLLITEVLSARGDSGVPLTVRDLVLARFAGLAPDAQHVVRLLAVVPSGTELWLLERALCPPSSTVEAAAAAGLLVVGEDAVGFRHELVRQAVEGSLSSLARRELNRQILTVLAAATDRGIDVARLVHHAREAGDTTAVLRYAPEAARQAAAVAAHREAVEHYRTVLPHAGLLPAPDRAELLEGYSVECYLSGLSAEAVAAGRQALELRETGDDRQQVGEALRWLSRLHWWDGDRRAAEAAAGRAITVLEAEPAGHQLAMAYSNQAQLDMLDNRLAAATRWAGRAAELARRLDDRETLSHALTNIGSARLLGGDSGGRADLEEGFEVAIAAGLHDDAARALCNLATISAEMFDYRNARRDLDDALVVHAGARAGRLRPAPARAPREGVAGPGGLGRCGAGRAGGAGVNGCPAAPGWWMAWCRWGCCRRAGATRPRRTPCGRRPSAGSPPSSCSGPRRSPRPWLSSPGCAARTTRSPRRRPACSSRRTAPSTRGSPGSWRSGSGWAALCRGRRWSSPSRTGCCWTATGGHRPTPGGSWAARTSRPWHSPAAARTRPG